MKKHNRVYIALLIGALSLGAEAIERSSQDPQEWMLRLGQQWLLEEDYQKILDSLIVEHEEIATTPWVQEVLVLRANALIGQGKLNEALQYLAELKKQAPGNPSIWLASAEAKALSLQFEEAYEELGQAQKKGAKMTDIARLQGDLYRLQDDIEASRVSYGRALRADPNNIEARLRLTSLQAEGSYLVDFYQNSLYLYQVLPHNPKVRLFYASTLIQKGSLVEAQGILEPLVKEHPTEEAAALLLSRLYFSQGSLVAAENLADFVFEQHPEDIQARTLLAAISLKLNKPKRTIELLTPYVSDITENQRTITLLGTAYMMNNQLDEGLSWLARVDELKKAERPFSGDASPVMMMTVSALPEADLQTQAVAILSALKRGQIEEAHRQALQYMREEGEGALTEYLVGLTAEASGNTASAILSYQSALLYDPRFLHADYQLAELYLKKNQIQEARMRLESVLERYPRDLTAMLQMARLEGQVGHLGQAVEWAQKADTSHPQETAGAQALVELYLHFHQPQKALLTAHNLYKRFPDNLTVGSLYGHLALNQGSTKEAQQLFRHLLKKYPKDPDLLQGLARAEMTLGKLNAAHDTLDVLLQEDESHLPALLLKSEVAFQQQDFEAIVGIGNQINHLFPTSNKGYTLLGDAYWATGKIDEAEAAYRSAFQKEPSAKLAKSLYETEQALGKPESSYNALEQWVQKNPGDLSSHRFLAGAYLNANDHQKAAQAYEQVLKKSQQDVIALNNLALIKVEHDPAGALKLAERAYELAPHEVKVVDTYAMALFHNGHYPEALKLLKQAKEKAPQDADISAHLAEVMKKVG